MSEQVAFQVEPFEFFANDELEWEPEVRRPRLRRPRPTSGTRQRGAVRPGVRMPLRPPFRAYPRPPLAYPFGPAVILRDRPPAEPSAKPPEREPSGSEYIRWVQSSLNALLGLRLPLDGIVGPETRSAIRSFQEKQGLPADGMVGPDTERALLAARQAQARSETEAETGIEVAGVALGAASLGLGVFQVIQTLTTGGDLSVEADIAEYMHQSTPANIPFTRARVDFKISAHHPRIGFDRQNFYFRLAFEYNGYDLRNVSIVPLRDRSSSLYASTLSIQFKASRYSQPSDPQAKIYYNIIQGRWDPVGRGDVTFNGGLVVKANGDVPRDEAGITSERGWVRWDGFVGGSRRDTRLALPPTPGLAPAPTPGTRPTLRSGARGQAVVDLQIRLNRWLVSQGRQPLTVDGILGRRTRAAVIAFQQAARLRPDGVVGPQTWATLVRHW